MGKTSSVKFDFLLILVTVFWGTGFIAVQFSLDSGLTPLTIIMLRMLFGAAIMLLFFFKKLKQTTRHDFFHGCIAGGLLFGGFILQTYGMQYTIISNSAFLTTTNVIMVPFISWIFLKKRPPVKIFLSVLLGFIGICILTRAFDANIAFNLGDVLCLLSAVCFASQIAYTEIAVKNVDATRFSFWEIAFAFVFALIAMVISEPATLPQIFNISLTGSGLLACLYLGATCTFFAFWAQSIAQRHMPSPKTALLLSLEAVFASLFSVLLGYEALQATLLIGGGIIMASIIILEVSPQKKALPRN